MNVVIQFIIYCKFNLTEYVGKRFDLSKMKITFLKVKWKKY